MADIELVIKIPEEDYVYIAKKHCLPSCDDRTLRKNVYEMITNGTSLPKGHGRLVDENILRYGLRNSYLDSFGLIRVENVLKNTDTIIEADQESDVE